MFANNKKYISKMAVICLLLLISTVFPGIITYASGWITVVSGTDNPHLYSAYQLISGKLTEDNVISEVSWHDIKE